jgi:4-hydroxybutyrate dehydrogenase
MLSTFSFPTTVRFGVGAIVELPARLAGLGASRPLVVTDAGLLKTGVFQTVQRLVGTQATVFSGVTPNPIEQDVESATEAFHNGKCDAVIALGGGSALDVGKVIRLRIKQPEMRLAQFTGQDPGSLAPLIAIPTTAGTGSEVGRSSVIIIGGKKRVIFHPSLLASLVILDPQLTADLPPRLTAATCADALTHCIESFTSPTFHPPCDGIALEAIRLIAEALPRAVKDGHDLDARGKMQVAAMMGGLAFQKDLGAVHSLAHPLSAICNVHHGLANALCLVPVMEFNAQRKPGLYRRIGQAMELSDVGDKAVIQRIRTLLSEIGLQGGLRAHGVSELQLDALADQAFQDSCHETNPVPVTRADLLELYRRSL